MGFCKKLSMKPTSKLSSTEKDYVKFLENYEPKLIEQPAQKIEQQMSLF
jgi:hypothetical protein